MAGGTVIVDPDSGAGTDYTTLSAAEAGEQGTLTEDMHVQCRASSGGNDTVSTTFFGWSPGSYYIYIERHADEPKRDAWTETDYILQAADTLQINEENTIVDGIQIEMNGTGYADYALLFQNMLTAITQVVINARVRNTAGSGDLQSAVYLGSAPSGTILLVQNCEIIDFSRTSGMGVRINDSDSTANVVNSTIHNCYTGCAESAGTLNVLNSIVFDCSDDFNITNGSINYCASDDGDGTNAISPSGSDWANELPDYATDDFTIDNGGNCYLGSEITNADDGNVPTIDIAGNARNTGAGEQTSVGAHEYVSGTVSLTVNSFINAQSLDNAILSQLHSLIINALNNSQSIDNVLLTQLHNINVSELAHSQTIDNVDIGLFYALIVSALAHSQSIDNADLSQIHNLVINSLNNIQSIDNVAISIVGVIELVVNAIAHAQTIDNIDLGQFYNLVVSALAHAHAVDNITVSVEGITALVVQALTHSQSIDSIDLGQLHNMSINSLSSAQSIDAISLSVLVSLVIQSLAHAQTIENISIGQFHVLIVDSLGQAQTIDNISLSQLHILIVDALTHAIDIESISISGSVGLASGGVTITIDCLKPSASITVLKPSANIEVLNG